MTLQKKWMVLWAPALLALFAAPAAAQMQNRPRPAISAAGPGILVGDWRLGVIVTTGTDDSNDTVNNKDRARVIEYNEAESKRQGEIQKNPMAKFIPGAKPEPPKPLGPGFTVAEKVHGQLAPGADRGRRGIAAAPAKGAAVRGKLTQRAEKPLRAPRRGARRAAGKGGVTPAVGAAVLMPAVVPDDPLSRPLSPAQAQTIVSATAGARPTPTEQAHDLIAGQGAPQAMPQDPMPEPPPAGEVRRTLQAEGARRMTPATTPPEAPRLPGTER